MLRINEIPQSPSILAIDTEVYTAGKPYADPFTDDIVLISMSDGNDTYVLTADFLRVKPLLEDKKLLKICHNVNFDYKYLKKLGIKPINFWDTLMVERVLNAGVFGVGNALNEVVFRRLGFILQKDVRESFKVKGISEQKIEYAAKDAEVLIPIYEQQLVDVERYGLDRVAAIENQLTSITAEMELYGIGFDPKAWDKVLLQEESEKNRLQMKILLELGVENFDVGMFGDFNPKASLNLNSQKEVLRYLKKKGIHLESTNKEEIRKYLDEHPDCQILRDFQDYRTHEKAIGFDYPKWVHPLTGKIHCSFNQIGTDTSRYSATDPNMQQVKRDNTWRALFTASSGHYLVTADYSQLQLRLMADVSNCSKMILAFREGHDLHIETAKHAFSGEIKKGDPRRQLGKNTNFAKIFGAYPKTLARSLNVDLKTATALANAFDALYPEVEQWGEGQFDFICQNGYSKDIINRRRYFSDITPQNQFLYRNKARNTPIQMYEADVVKTAMIRAWNAGYQPVLQVHDEIVFEVDANDLDEVENIKYILQSAGKEFTDKVPLEAEATISERWQK